MSTCESWVPDGDWAVTDAGLKRTFHSNHHDGYGLSVELRSMVSGLGLQVEPVVMIFIAMYASNLPSPRL